MVIDAATVGQLGDVENVFRLEMIFKSNSSFRTPNLPSVTFQASKQNTLPDAARRTGIHAQIKSGLETLFVGLRAEVCYSVILS